MGNLIQDVRYGLRMLAKNPGFAAIAVLTLALGIGANTAVFSVVNAILLKGLPVEHPDQIVALSFHQKGSHAAPLFSYLDYEDVRKQADSSMDIFAYYLGLDGLSAGGQADRVVDSYVTGNYFTALGLKPALGRLILPSEGAPSRSDPVLVLGYSYWMSRFGGSPDVIGKQVSVDGHPFTIVGVAPKGFQGMLESMEMQVYMPMNMAKIQFGGFLDDRTARNLMAYARLKSGSDLAQAKATLSVVAHRLSQEHPKSDVGASIWVVPQREVAYNPLPQPGEYQMTLVAAGLFLALAGFVLLLACFNVANLLLVRATAREHEMSVRTALGAPRFRLARMMLSESLLIALLGCGGGLMLGAWASAAISSIHLNIGVPLVLRVGLDWHVATYAILAAILASVLAGTMPALRAAAANPGAALHEGGRTATARHNRLRNGLVMGQVAGSIVLLVVAGLFTHSLEKASHMDLGFSPDHVSNFMLDPHEIGYNNQQGKQFYKELLTRVRALPGVQSASVAFNAPLGQYHDMEAVYVEGRATPSGQPAPSLSLDAVTPGYFRTNGIPLVEGRAFSDADTEKTQHVAVINQTMAKEFWPGEDPVGRRFRLNKESNPPIEVVGVARDSKYRSLLEKPGPFFYLPLTQYYISMGTLQVRSLLPPGTINQQVESLVHGLGPGLPIFGVHTMQQVVDGGGGLYQFRLGAYLAAALGVLGLVLAIVGVYGVISFSVSQRIHEFGIRMALGARPGDLWRIVLRQGLTILGVGVLAGLLMALGLTRVMAHLLYGVSAHDPLTYLGVTALIAAVTLLACYFPARRAARVDPMVALRYE